MHHAEAALPLAEAPAESEPAAAARVPAEHLGKAATTAPTLQRRRLLLDETVSPRPPTPDELAAQASPAMHLAASCVLRGGVCP